MQTGWPLGHGTLGPTFATYSVGQIFSTYAEVHDAIEVVFYCQMHDIDRSAANRRQLFATADALLTWLYAERRRLEPRPKEERPICKVFVFIPCTDSNPIRPFFT